MSSSTSRTISVQEDATLATSATSDKVPRELPLRIAGLYDEPEMISDADLAAVLSKVRPRFDQKQLKPNFVEHALRTWGVDAEFRDPEVMSGIEMRDFLIDHGKYLVSWGNDVAPLLQEQPEGISIRWGRETGASVHHDHWLACLTEAGVSLHEPVFTPGQRSMTIESVLHQSLLDFRLDERETEWTVLAFGLWLPPIKQWTSQDGRTLSFDDLAERQLRGHNKYGVCSGTHRLYSLMVLIRLDDEFDILTPSVREKVLAHLGDIRDILVVSQLPDGRWPDNWWLGKTAVETPIVSPLHEDVISTGHHLEWLSIAPKELHPPHEQIERAAKWIIETTKSQNFEAIQGKFTFYSHVGNALALWRQTRPADFWKRWEVEHPEEMEDFTAVDESNAKGDDSAHH
ncbi:MAG: hypothetical protein O3A29_13740 [Planctomycetota bacterium]|nr:hypothetical protein [Planctomycetota bacterium]